MRTFSNKVFGEDTYKVTLSYVAAGPQMGYIIEIRSDNAKPVGEVKEEVTVPKNQIWNAVDQLCSNHKLPLHIITVKFSNSGNETFSLSDRIKVDLDLFDVVCLLRGSLPAPKYYKELVKLGFGEVVNGYDWKWNSATAFLDKDINELYNLYKEIHR